MARLTYVDFIMWINYLLKFNISSVNVLFPARQYLWQISPKALFSNNMIRNGTALQWIHFEDFRVMSDHNAIGQHFFQIDSTFRKIH
jgi:hypothetical protein